MFIFICVLNVFDSAVNSAKTFRSDNWKFSTHKQTGFYCIA